MYQKSGSGIPRVVRRTRVFRSDSLASRSLMRFDAARMSSENAALQGRVDNKNAQIKGFKQDLRYLRREINKSAIKKEMKMSAETGEPFILHGSWVKIIPPNEASAAESNRRKQVKFARARARRLFWQRAFAHLRPIGNFLREARVTSWIF